MKRTTVILSAICLLASCAKDIVTMPGHEDLVPMDFYAAFDEEAATKAALSGSSSDDVRSLVWAVDDSIMVSNGVGVAKFRNSSTTAAASAVFKGQIAYGKEYFAAYPYSRTTSYSGGAFNVELPQTQKYFKDGVDPKALLMVAKSVDGEFRFKNICGIVVVNIKGEGEVKSLTFSATDSEGKAIKVAGKGKVMMNYSNAPTLAMDNSAAASVTMNCLDADGRGVQLSKDGTPFHFVLPAGQYSNFTVRVRLTNDSMKKTSVNPMTVKRSERTTMSVIPFESAGSDLSSNGTANCYLVTSLGEHVFDATVKGNSSELVGNAKSVKVLWQTKMNDEAPAADEIISDVVLDGGDVVFNANKNGNAGIAVCDADGNILWSWHIWIIDGYDAHASAQTYYNGAGIFMDRNLGALVATSSSDNTSRGLSYYWGRKDPFDGESYYVPDNQGFQWFSSDQFAIVKPDIAYAVRNPMMRIDSYWGDDYSIVRSDWLYKQTEDRKQVDTLRWNASKTMYDPCPPGWKVPGRVYSRAAGVTSVDCSNQDKDDNGINLSGVLADDASVWYPNGSYWIGSAYTGISYYSNSQTAISTWAYDQYVHSGNSWLNFDYSSASLNSRYFVRCCDERGVPSVGRADVSDVKTNTATCYAEVLSDGGFDITDTGFIVSSDSWRLDDSQVYKYIKEKPESGFVMISRGVNRESFTAALSDLDQSTTYYVRAYAANQIGIGLGEMAEFRTLTGGGNEGVDRGDDIQW